MRILKASRALLFAFMAVLLAACGNDEPQQQMAYQQPVQQPVQQYAQPAPVVVQNDSGGSAMSNMMLGALAGHALSGGGNRQQAPTIVNRTTVIKQYAPPTPVQSFSSRNAPSRTTFKSFSSRSRK